MAPRKLEGLAPLAQQAAPPWPGPRRDGHHTSIFPVTLTWVMVELLEPHSRYACGPSPPGFRSGDELSEPQGDTPGQNQSWQEQDKPLTLQCGPHHRLRQRCVSLVTVAPRVRATPPPGDQSRPPEPARLVGFGILALSTSGYELLGRPLSSVCPGEKPQAPESHPGPLHCFCWGAAPGHPW